MRGGESVVIPVLAGLRGSIRVSVKKLPQSVILRLLTLLWSVVYHTGLRRHNNSRSEVMEKVTAFLLTKSKSKYFQKIVKSSNMFMAAAEPSGGSAWHPEGRH